MRALVVYASRHGATKAIAERITATLRESGVPADLMPAEAAHDVDAYDAFVIGSAAYAGAWMREATQFVRSHRETLAMHPVWLFSSGPVGGIAMPEPKELAEFRAAIEPRGDHVFAGKLAAGDLSFAEQLMASVVHVTGDFRDWPAIEAWARDIGASLRAAPDQATVGVLTAR